MLSVGSGVGLSVGSGVGLSVGFSDVSGVDSVLLVVVDDVVELISGLVDCSILTVVDGISLDSLEDVVDGSVDVEPIVVSCWKSPDKIP